MLELQIRILSAWIATGQAIRHRLDTFREDGDRGEVTATTALIVLLVIAAIAAGTIIAAKITSNANNVPSP